MICLTGDIHHASLGTGNQQHCDLSEVEVAARYLRLLEEREIRVTFFISGLTFVEEWPEIAPIVRHPLVEVGGHTWSCFTPAIVHRVSKKLLGSYNGPPWLQRWDAKRTIQSIEDRTGKRIRAWRNHMYMHGPFTERVLSGLGIEVCSDGVRKDVRGPEWHPAGIWNFPINVIPDHEHLYHAERTPEWVERWRRRYNWSDDFGAESYYIDEWVDLVLAGIERNEARGAISNIIVHPITMYLCDRFSGITRILDFLRDRETVYMSRAVELARQHKCEQPASPEVAT